VAFRLKKISQDLVIGELTSTEQLAAQIRAAQVFWPTSNDPLFHLVGTFPFPTSDHRLVWIDVRVQLITTSEKDRMF
jgi:hypothetical protein